MCNFTTFDNFHSFLSLLWSKEKFRKYLSTNSKIIITRILSIEIVCLWQNHRSEAGAKDHRISSGMVWRCANWLELNNEYISMKFLYFIRKISLYKHRWVWVMLNDCYLNSITIFYIWKGQRTKIISPYLEIAWIQW